MDLQRTGARTARWLRRRLPWLLLLAAIAWIVILVVWIAADPVPVNQ
jgi:Na+/melibiose symporter-like transporter